MFSVMEIATVKSMVGDGFRETHNTRTVGVGGWSLGRRRNDSAARVAFQCMNEEIHAVETHVIFN